MDKRKFLVIETRGMDADRLQSRLDRLTEKHNDLKIESTIGTRLIVSFEQKEKGSDGILTAEMLIEGMQKIAKQNTRMNGI